VDSKSSKISDNHDTIITEACYSQRFFIAYTPRLLIAESDFGQGFRAVRLAQAPRPDESNKSRKHERDKTTELPNML